MKKIISLILVCLSVFGCAGALASCTGNNTPEIYSIASSVSATRTVTYVEYTTASGEELNGEYIMDVEGNNSIFTYKYDRYRTTEEALTEGTADRIKHVEGALYYKDGKYSVNGEAWDAANPVAIEIKLNLDEELLNNTYVSKDGRTLTATLSPENAAKVLGTDLNAEGDISIEVLTNGTYLTSVNVFCNTVSGAEVVIRTSYSYNRIELDFPEIDAE